MKPNSLHRVNEAYLVLGKAAFVIDPAGVLFWPAESLLVVADLHLEKGSAYAARRVFLPPYDTAATLARLHTLIFAYAPRRVLALGDSFHDAWADARLSASDRAALQGLQKGREWIWVAGNHDPQIPADLAGERLDEIGIGPVVFRHQPQHGCEANEIAGHLHPTARVFGAAGSVRRRCFVSDGKRCILPAFGAYAGGLNWCDPAFAGLFAEDEKFAHVMGRGRIYKISAARCLPD
ncbi:MAG: ligase-associated DNA damage response endonuclease PdeM [Beijerinckiaceae bacterium]